ncbi:hypothetical protein LTR27_003829 [Elasticomyces elasticus]|nr:hypothetical protein LTR27_003829 [Elasticomyces elasticus]
MSKRTRVTLPSDSDDDWEAPDLKRQTASVSASAPTTPAGPLPLVAGTSDTRPGRHRPQQRPTRPEDKATSTRALIIASTVGRELKTPGEIFAKPGSRRLLEAKKALDSVQVTRKAAVTLVEKAKQAKIDQQHAFNPLFEAPTINGRRFRAKLDRHDYRSQGVQKTTWLLGAVDSRTKEYRFIASANPSLYDEATATKLCDLLASLVNAWPGTLDTISGDKVPQMAARTGVLRGLVLAAACRRLNIDQKVLGPLFLAAHSNTNPSVVGRTYRIDPTTYAATSEAFNLPVARVPHPLTSENRIALPPGWIFSAAAAGNYLNQDQMTENQLVKFAVDDKSGLHFHGTGLTEIKLGKAESLRPRLEMAEQIVRAVIVQTHGLMCTKNELRMIIDRIVLQYAEPNKRSPGVYDGRKIVRWDRQPRLRLSCLAPSKLVRRDCKGTLPGMTLHSLDRTRALPIIDAIDKKFVDSKGDIKEAWLAGLEAHESAEIDIANGVKAPSVCNCAPGDKSNTSHPCGMCGASCLCSKRRRNALGLDCCEICYTIDAKSGRSSLPEESLVCLAKGSVRREAGKAVDSAHWRGIIRDLIDELRGFFQGDPKLLNADGTKKPVYLDEYTGQYVEMSADSFMHPDNISPDAINPYAIDTHGRQYIHMEGNLGFYIRQLEAVLKGSTTLSEGELREMIIKASAVCRKVRIKFGWAQAARHGTVSHKQYKYDLEQMKAGKLRPQDERPAQPWNHPSYSLKNAERHRLWPQDDIDRVKGLVEALESEFDVKLPGLDECAWIRDSHAVPEGWGWGMVNALFSRRWTRIRDGCNKGEAMWDRPDNLYVEGVFQSCVNKCKIKEGTEGEEGKQWTNDEKRAFKERYSKFLNLPLVADVFDALCFALAHAEHGQPMRTSWVAEPRDLGDRDDSLNNMLFETRTSNYLKANFPQECYPKLKDMMRNVRIPDEIITIGGEPLADVLAKFEIDCSGIDQEAALRFAEEVAVHTEAFVGDDEDDFEDEEEDDSEDEVESGEQIAGGHGAEVGHDADRKADTERASEMAALYEDVQQLAVDSGRAANSKLQECSNEVEKAMAASQED